MRTQEEIDAEIKKLETLRTQVPPRTYFGDSNLDAIDAQIKVLRERMDEMQVYDFGWDERTESSAREAAGWLEGDPKLLADDPEGWLSIAKK